MQHLQEERRFADAGVAAEERHLARHEPAAERPVELAEAGGDALAFGGRDRIERHRFRRLRGVAMRTRLFHRRLAERAGGAAGRTAAEPLQRRSTALGANIGAFGARHYATSTTGTRGASAQRSS